MQPGVPNFTGCTVLDQADGYRAIDKPPGVAIPPDSFGSLEVAASGASFGALSREVATEAGEIWKAQRSVEVYVAILRGQSLPLLDIIRCHRRLCRPSEGSQAWRIAGSRREGREALTLVRAVRRLRFSDELCTLVELRPVTCCPQQLRLHCVALGHPIVGDDFHSSDRRLDFCFDQDLQADRLMLHCRYLRVPLRSGIVEVVTPRPFQGLLGASDEAALTCDEELERAGHSGAGAARNTRASVGGILAAEEVGGLTNQCPDGAWEKFAGGLSEAIFDDTHWDHLSYIPRAFKCAPYGPRDWDDRNPGFINKSVESTRGSSA